MKLRPHTLELWQSATGWRWRMLSPNGRLVAESGESYVRRDKAHAAMARVVAAMPTARYVLTAP